MSSSAIALPTPPLGPWANGMIMSPEEFDAAAEWDSNYRYELLHGVLIVSPAPSFGDRGPNDELGYLLRSYRYDHPAGKVLDDTVSEQTIDTTICRRRADRVVWIGLGRYPNPVTDVPALVIEFVSDSMRDRRRDYEEKRREYLEIGVKEDWVIDRFQRKMMVHRSTETVTVAEQETYCTPLLPGFELSPARLFAIADAGENI